MRGENDGPLSARQLECVRLMCHGGLNARQIADRMFVSEQTVRDHLVIVYRKLAIFCSRKDALTCHRLGMAEASGILDPAAGELPAMRDWQV